MKKEYKTRKILILKSNVNYDFNKVEQFKLELLFDMEVVLNNIFDNFHFNNNLDIIYSIDRNENTLSYLTKIKKSELDMFLVSTVFSKLNYIIDDINVNLKFYMDKWENKDWTIIKEFINEYYYEIENKRS